MLIKNAILLDRKGRRNGWIQTDGSTIIATGEGEPDENIVASDNEIIDACGAYVCPGLIDSHVHFREPGLEYKATIAGESRAALAGGITTVYDMPNTKPATTTAEALWAKKPTRAGNRIDTLPRLFRSHTGLHGRTEQAPPRRHSGHQDIFGHLYRRNVSPGRTRARRYTTLVRRPWITGCSSCRRQRYNRRQHRRRNQPLRQPRGRAGERTPPHTQCRGLPALRRSSCRTGTPHRRTPAYRPYQHRRRGSRTPRPRRYGR